MKRKISKYGVIAIVIYICAFCILSSLVYYMDKKYDVSRMGTEDVKKFGISFMTMNNPFFAVISDSIKAAVEANGDVVIVRDPALDSEKQDRQIRDMLDEGIDVLFVNPVDFEAVMPAIKEAKSKGVIVISVDSEIYDEDLADCVVVSDNYLAGKQCAEYLMTQKDSAEILVLEHNKTKSAIDRVNGFMDALDGHDEYTIVGVENAEGQLEISMPIISDVLEDGKEFDTVFAINDLSALGALAAIKDHGRIDSIDVLGVDGAPEAKAMIKEGLMMATTAQYPTQIGDYAVEQAYKVLRNEPYDKKILVNVELVSKDNVDEFGTGSWQ